MSLYVVLVDTDYTRSSGPESALKVLAHNLSRDAAEQLRVQLSDSSVEGHSVGIAPYVWEYEEPHARTDPVNCLECAEIALEHYKEVVRLLVRERARRAGGVEE
jgi:hypothetical protein